MSDDLTLFGYRIVCDTREVPGTPIWLGKAAVVQPADCLGVERVHRILGDACFTSEKAVSDYLIAEAKKWIDNQLETRSGMRSSAALGWKAQSTRKGK